MMFDACTKRVSAVVIVLAQVHFAGALVSTLSMSVLSRLRTSSREASVNWSHQRQRLRWRSGRLHHERRTGAPPLAMIFEKRPEERALGDILVPEDAPGSGHAGVSVEPPGFLKRLFSVPKNVRRTAATGDVVVPVIGARDGWGGIRQRLVDQGIYPGVEYRILEVSVFPTATATATSPTVNSESSSTSSDLACATPFPSPASQQQHHQQQPDLDSEPTTLLTSARDAPPGSFEDGSLVFTMRPIYPLIPRLERDWPVRLAAREFPVMLTPFSYNAATAWAALTTSLSLLAAGFVLSQTLTLSVINSHSMEPTLQVGDVVLVEKVYRSFFVRTGDIVYFRPPPVLQEVVSRAGGTLSPSDLFVKRVAAVPGDTVTVSADGSVDVHGAFAARKPPVSGRKQAQIGGEGDTNLGAGLESLEGSSGMGATAAAAAAPAKAKGAALPESVLRRIARLDKKVLTPGTVFVLGDNPAASMDSRVWGQLDEGEIVGHALLRVLPLRSFGLLP